MVILVVMQGLWSLCFFDGRYYGYDEIYARINCISKLDTK